MMRSLNTALYLILNGMIRIPFCVRLSGLPFSSQKKRNGRHVDSIDLEHIHTSEGL